jgi:hypothetical protein
MNKCPLALVSALLLLPATHAAQAQASKYLKLNKDGTGNIVFSTTPIKKNEEAKSKLQTRFTSSDSIYARAYFSKPMGEFKGEEEGFIDVWIDGKHEKRLNFSNKDVPADRDQMVVYVFNTQDYKPDFKSEVWDGLSAGQHQVKLIVGRTKFLRKGASAEVVGDKLVVRRDDPHAAVYLSDSTFTFVKE